MIKICYLKRAIGVAFFVALFGLSVNVFFVKKANAFYDKNTGILNGNGVWGTYSVEVFSNQGDLNSNYPCWFDPSNTSVDIHLKSLPDTISGVLLGAGCNQLKGNFYYIITNNPSQSETYGNQVASNWVLEQGALDTFVDVRPNHIDYLYVTGSTTDQMGSSTSVSLNIFIPFFDYILVFTTFCFAILLSWFVYYMLYYRK